MRELKPYGKGAALWQSYVDRLPYVRRDVLLTPAYARVQATLGQGEPVCLVSEHEEHFVMMPTMKRPVGNKFDLASFYGGGGPIVCGDDVMIGHATLPNVICEYAQLMPGYELHPFILNPPLTQKVRDAVVVDIDKDDEDLLASFSRNRRRGIKEAQQEGWSAWPVELDRKALLWFGSLYNENMDRLGATKHWRWPSVAWEAYANELPEYATYITASPNNTAARINSMLLVLHGYGKARAHIIAGGAFHDLVYYEAMKYCRDVGCKTFFLGGGTTSAENDPLLQYKLGFSKTTVPVYAYKRVFDDEAYCLECGKVGIEPVMIHDFGSGKWRVDTMHHGFFPGYRSKEAA